MEITFSEERILIGNGSTWSWRKVSFLFFFGLFLLVYLVFGKHLKANLTRGLS
jgi:hypothetical protein